MYTKFGIDDMMDSQIAINEYMNFRRENRHKHKVQVCISSNGRNRFNGVLDIFAVLHANSSYVFLEGDEAFERDFYSQYSVGYQTFKFVGGILLIQANDKWGNAIELDISGV